MRFILSTLAVMAALVLIAVSGAMNFLFMQGMGKDSTESLVLGAASVAIDIFKAVLPILIWWSWREGRVGFMVTAIAMFSIFTGFSLTSAIGFSASNRVEISGVREGANAQLSAVTADIKMEEARLTGLPPYRPSTVLEQQINRLRTDRAWSSTKGCTNATAKRSRKFCADYFELKAELESAILGERSQRRLSELKRALSQLKSSGAGGDTDPQVTVLAQLSGSDKGSVRTALIIFVAVLLELGSGLGLWMATGHSEIFRRKAYHRPSGISDHSLPVLAPEAIHAASLNAMPMTGLTMTIEASDSATLIAGIEDYVLDRIRPAERGELTPAELYTDYQKWVQALKKPLAAEELFQNVLQKIMEEVGVQTEGESFLGISFAPNVLAA